MRCPGAIRAEIAAVDLADAAARDGFLASLDARGYVPDVLVNNAGAGASGAFADADWGKLDAMLRLNVVALAPPQPLGRPRHEGAWQTARSSISRPPWRPARRPISAPMPRPRRLSPISASLCIASCGGTGVHVAAIHPPAVRTSFSDPGKADLRVNAGAKTVPLGRAHDGRARSDARCPAQAPVGDRRSGRCHRPWEPRRSCRAGSTSPL